MTSSESSCAPASAPADGAAGMMAPRPRPSPRRLPTARAGLRRPRRLGIPDRRPPRLAAADDLSGQVGVGAAATRVGIVVADRLAVAGRLTEPDVAGDDSLEDLVRIALPHLLHDLTGKRGAAVVEGHHDPEQPQPRV